MKNSQENRITNKESFFLFFFQEQCLMWRYPLETWLVSVLGKPGRPLPLSLNDPLALILLWGCLPRVQHHGLRGRSPERAPFLLPHLSSDFRCLLAHLLIAIATEDVFLFQVSTFRTNIYIVLNFNKLLRVSSSTPVNFNATSVFGSCHPKDTIQKAGNRLASIGIICWFCTYSWTLDGQCWSPRMKGKA